MIGNLPDWAAWGSLAEEQFAGEARALRDESLRAPVDRARVERLLDLYGQRFDTLPAYLRDIVGDIEVRD
ncbi:MAG TPA: hypothetical protein IAA19_04005 [Candidatus Olsenella pullistercoris]|uniref:Uncharacterized protein n=1 Tax=Candidatus Olsenella pullistercoris TaxID=2838712 RepID=A0A9D2JEX4_9ACTN|nr:hypothetical protein [Candidatus Olsenella pullistercoris]